MITPATARVQRRAEEQAAEGDEELDPVQYCAQVSGQMPLWDIAAGRRTVGTESSRSSERAWERQRAVLVAASDGASNAF